MSLVAPLGLEHSTVFPDGGIYSRIGDKSLHLPNTWGKICVSSEQYENHLQKPCHAPGELWEARGVSQAGPLLAQERLHSPHRLQLLDSIHTELCEGSAFSPAWRGCTSKAPRYQSTPRLGGASDKGGQLFSCDPEAPSHCSTSQIPQTHGSTIVETIDSIARD